jgi:hypothetical protein
MLYEGVQDHYEAVDINGGTLRVNIVDQVPLLPKQAYFSSFVLLVWAVPVLGLICYLF